MKYPMVLYVALFAGCTSLSNPYLHYDKELKIQEQDKVSIVGHKNVDLSTEELYDIGRFLGDTSVELSLVYIHEIDGYKRKSNAFISSDMASFNSTSGRLDLVIAPGEHILKLSLIEKETRDMKSSFEIVKVNFIPGHTYALASLEFSESCSGGLASVCTSSWLPIVVNLTTQESWIVLKGLLVQYPLPVKSQDEVNVI